MTQSLSVEERLALIRQVGEEIIDEEELATLLKAKERFVAYDGFEPSGKIHIAQAVLRAINVNRMIKAGAEFTMFVADWHAWANQKLGGDLEKIQTTGKYFIEVWRASGMDLDHVKFVWASELVKDEAYWRLVMKVATSATLKRVLRTTQIMGRSENEKLHASQILYPCMQAADIFYLQADVCQLGMDQRKVNMLARELAPKLGKEKPIIVSHHMLMGLQEPLGPTIVGEKSSLKVGDEFAPIYPYFIKIKSIKQDEVEVEYSEAGIIKTLLKRPILEKEVDLEKKEQRDEDLGEKSPYLNLCFVKDKNDTVRLLFKRKTSPLERALAMKMSKSKPDTAIFVTDSEEEVVRKLQKAYCPAGVAEENPVLEYCQHIIFALKQEFTIERPEKFGGNVTFNSYEELEQAFVRKELHPMDLKAATAKYVNEILQPIRDHFANDPAAKRLKEQVESFAVTR